MKKYYTTNDMDNHYDSGHRDGYQKAKDELEICSGCGHTSLQKIEPPALACCPDSRYISVEQFFKESYEKRNANAKELKRLQHHEATTIGLWATDRPDLVQDPEKIMYQLTETKQ